jgi:predicted permease
MGSLLNDLRYTFRSLQHHPGFAFVAVFSLALGIGVNTAIFSVYRTIFRPDPGVEDVEELVQVAGYDIYDLQGSYPEYLDYRAQTRDIFEDLIAYVPYLALVDLGGTSEVVFFEEVTGNYFEMLGVRPALGRIFVEADDTPEAEPVVVLSHATWQAKLGADPGIVGRTVKMNGHSFTVIGVAPADFPGMYPFTVACWTPINQYRLFTRDRYELDRRQSGASCYIKGRLKDGVSIGQAREALGIVRARLAREYPEVYRGRMTGELVYPAREVVIVPEIDRPIRLLSWFLMGLVGLVLVVACTNLASILLARASARQREIGIRLALGAGRWRLIRQLLTESVTLGLMGGLAGIPIAYGLIRLLVAVRPPLPLEVNLEFGVSGEALLFTLGLSVLTGILFGLLPARQATHPRIVQTLRGTAPTFGGRRRFGWKNTLIVAQVAVSAVLLLCAGLLMRSLTNATAVDPGFELRRGVIFDLAFEFGDFTDERAVGLLREVRERFRALPGVEQVGVAERIPLNFSNRDDNVMPLEPAVEVGERGVRAGVSDADPDFFRAMGIPLRRGRFFDQGDVREGPRVAIVNETFAERFWPGQDPIGRQFRTFYGKDLYTIVGVVKDGKYRTLGERQQPFFWGALDQRTFHQETVTFVVRTSLPERDLIPILRQEARTIDPDLPLFDLKTASQYRGVTLFIPRLVGAISSALGLFALVLGTTGLYGIIAFEVSRRTREIGVRMALGARRRAVLALILGNGLRLVLAGLLIGVPVAALAARGLSALLYGIAPFDPVTFLGIPMLLIGVTVAATLTPALRAARINPIEALRHE